MNALAEVEKLVDGYDVYVTGDTGDSASAGLAAEMQVVMIIAVVIILLVLLFTSHTYMEIPVLIATFGMAALMNKGTNFIFGEISFVSDSVAVVLQLALAIDYAIILCHRYTEERTHLEAREAVVIALSKAIPEIAGSSMTTLSGLGAIRHRQGSGTCADKGNHTQSFGGVYAYARTADELQRAYRQDTPQEFRSADNGLGQARGQDAFCYASAVYSADNRGFYFLEQMPLRLRSDGSYHNA